MVPSLETFQDKITFGYGLLKNDKELVDWTWNNQQITSRSSAHKPTKGWPMCEYYYLCTWSRLIIIHWYCQMILNQRLHIVYISYKMDDKDIWAWKFRV